MRIKLSEIKHYIKDFEEEKNKRIVDFISYSVWFPADLKLSKKEAEKQLNRVYRKTKYYTDKKYKETNIYMCLSLLDPKTEVKGKKKTGKPGRPKTIIRSQSFYKNKVFPHLHYLAWGKGAAAITDKIARGENKYFKCNKHFKHVNKNKEGNYYFPLDYYKKQAIKSRTIKGGN